MGWEKVEKSNGKWVKAKKPKKVPASTSFIKGMMDPIHGGAQLLANAVPNSVEQSVNEFNNWLVDKGVPLTRLPAGGVSEQVRSEEEEYLKARKDAGQTGMDWWRVGGNVASPVNLAIASKIPQAGSLLGRVGLGAAEGATMGGLTPTTDDAFWEEKVKQMTIGGLTGGILPAVTGGIARVVKPKSSPAVGLLKSEGITPVPGQHFGPGTRRIEEGLSTIPIVGDIMRAAERRSMLEFNKSVANRALKNVGKTVPDNIDEGYDMVRHVHRTLTREYDELLPQLGGRLDTQLADEISTIKQMARTGLKDDEYKRLTKILDDDLYGRFTNFGRASGTTIKEIETKLRSEYSRLKSSADPDHRKVAEALNEVRNSLRTMLVRENPEKGHLLAPLNKGWAEYKTFSRAARNGDKADGVFTPAQYDNAIKATDKSFQKTKYEEGIALNQDLSRAANEVLPRKLPDSGTGIRSSLAALGLLGTGMINPSAPVFGGLLALPYSPVGQKIFSGAMTKRPEPMASLLNSAIRSAPPYITPGAVGGMLDYER